MSHNPYSPPEQLNSPGRSRIPQLSIESWGMRVFAVVVGGGLLAVGWSRLWLASGIIDPPSSWTILPSAVSLCIPAGLLAVCFGGTPLSRHPWFRSTPVVLVTSLFATMCLCKLILRMPVFQFGGPFSNLELGLIWAVVLVIPYQVITFVIIGHSHRIPLKWSRVAILTFLAFLLWLLIQYLTGDWLARDYPLLGDCLRKSESALCVVLLLPYLDGRSLPDPAS